MQTSKGTFPVGSMWRRNPIPACNCDAGKACGVNKTLPNQPAYPDYMRAYAAEAQPEPVGNSQACSTGTHFPVPCPKCYGQSQFGRNQPRNMWAIVDEVQVPNVTGDFVLRWRWDTEQVSPHFEHSRSNVSSSCFSQASCATGFTVVGSQVVSVWYYYSVARSQNPQIWTHCADVTIA
eukprot:SAG31_NODE_1477_length_8194_cov_21.653490_5_plen_178_part_00